MVTHTHLQKRDTKRERARREGGEGREGREGGENHPKSAPNISMSEVFGLSVAGLFGLMSPQILGAIPPVRTGHRPVPKDRTRFGASVPNGS